MEEISTDVVETTETPVKKINAVGKSIYGDKFVSFQRVGEISHLIPGFKEYYYLKKIEDFKVNSAVIIKQFNAEVAYPVGDTFHPYWNQVKGWSIKWNRDLIEQKKIDNMPENEARIISQIINTRRSDGSL